VTQPVPQGSVLQLISNLLDKNYTRATSAVLNSLNATVVNGVVSQRLKEFEVEAARLEAAGEKLTADNPVLKTLLGDLDTALKRGSVRIDSIASDLQTDAVDAAAKLTRQLALPGMDDQQLATIGIKWNNPDPEAVQRLVQFADSAPWQQQLNKYATGLVDTVRNQAIRGIVEGWNPLRTAKAIASTTQGLPLYQANTLMRTLQLQSYRTASAVYHQYNDDILVDHIRIAALDSRTCLACVALHGTRLPLYERVNDHWNGRCTSIAVTKFTNRKVGSGEDWFNAQPQERQLQMAGPGKYNLLQSGKITLRDLVENHEDPIFGEMVREISLKKLPK